MFNNCNSKTNGELLFYNLIKDKITTIFDIGCRNDSEFINFNGEVHYFDPINDFIESLKICGFPLAVSAFGYITIFAFSIVVTLGALKSAICPQPDFANPTFGLSLVQ